MVTKTELLEQLEGVTTRRSVRGFQHVFQGGYNNIISDPYHMSVNSPVGLTPDSLFPLAQADGLIQYKWNEQFEVTLSNHSELPIYVTIRMVSPKSNIPRYEEANAVLGATFDALQKATPEDYSTFNEMMYLGYRDVGISGGDIKYGNQGYSGYWNNASSDRVFTYGEGLNTTPASLSVPTNWDSTGGHTGTTHSMSIPYGLTLFDASPIMPMFKAGSVNRIVLAPAQQFTFRYGDNSLNFRSDPRFGDSKGRFEDPWEGTLYLMNKYQSFPTFEVHGSVVGQGATDTEASNYQQTGVWPATVAGNDALDWRDINRKVSIHGGILRMFVSHVWKTGSFESEEDDQIVHAHSSSLQIVGHSDAPVTLYRKDAVIH